MREMLILWILSAMTQLSPPHRTHYEPVAQESYAQADARYRSIAEDVVDESLAGPTVLKGSEGAISTSMLVTIMFFMESGFRRDIDLGIGRAQLRHTGLNDFGRSWCMGQINLGWKRVPDPDKPGMWRETSATTTEEGWYGPELTADRRKCVRATINALKRGMLACKHLPAEQRLASYAAGRCDSEDGKKLSEVRMRLFFRWNSRQRPQLKDADILKEISDAASARARGTQYDLGGVLRVSQE